MPGLMDRSSKVPEVTLGFWIVKIAATTLGETGGDTLSMSLHLGYAQSSLIFLVLFIGAVTLQLRALRFHPWVYWFAIVSTTLVGTTMADFADRSLGIGYAGGTALLLGWVLLTLAAWRLVCGTISAANIVSVRMEGFYWATILASNTLGTALGDFASDGLEFRLRGRGFVLLRAAWRAGAVLWVYPPLPRLAVLGRLYPHPPAGGHFGRPIDQAARPWRV